MWMFKHSHGFQRKMLESQVDGSRPLVLVLNGFLCRESLSALSDADVTQNVGIAPVKAAASKWQLVLQERSS